MISSVPAKVLEFLYTKILVGPLRTLTNWVILSLIPNEISIPEGTLVLNKKDPVISGSLTFGIYEPFEAELFRGLLRSGMTVVDIGANIGYYTIIAARRVAPGGKVIAFEPEPENFAFLNASVEKNGFKNVSLHNLAVSDKAEKINLNLYESNKGKHSIVKDSVDSREFSETILIQSIALDEFLKTQGVSQIDIIKMDIEGAESLALSGMQKTLAKANVLFMEFTPDSVRKAGHDPVAVLALLRSGGFILKEIDEHKKTTREIVDDAAFVDAIPNARCANLLCTKI